MKASKRHLRLRPVVPSLGLLSVLILSLPVDKNLGIASLQFKIPAIYQYRDFVVAGGAMSYGGDIKDSY